MLTYCSLLTTFVNQVNRFDLRLVLVPNGVASLHRGYTCMLYFLYSYFSSFAPGNSCFSLFSLFSSSSKVFFLFHNSLLFFLSFYP